MGAPVLAPAQLPPDAVDLAKVKIPRTLESTDLCPVHLVPSAADGETWSHDGVDYRASEAGSRETFLADPAKYVDQHERELWVLNFMNAMSTIWCPITDEVTPGGRKRVDGHGYTWESCCSFCDEEMSPENFTDALETLRERAEESYELTGGAYVEGATSPVEGAIKDSF
ncbi:MAG: hypothetical protein DWQ36_00420 [Acidobacteria bacterium]|nr:MAG: hypothetical protein DWQ30_18570 [Acidobacteriota bacterium]REK12161.1 MAG: hypothetical protein DWQ36_00420 [Acidobacteriota bacterium]